MASAALQKIIDLEKEVSKLRHHVSVLSKRNHALKKEVEKKKEEEACEEVASPVRGKEPEPQGVAEPSDQVMSSGAIGHIVVEEEEDVWVAPVATPRVVTPPVEESRVPLVVENGPSVVTLPKGKRRLRVEGGREEGVIVATEVPRGPRGGGRGLGEGVPRGPRSSFMGRGGRGGEVVARRGPGYGYGFGAGTPKSFSYVFRPSRGIFRRP